MKRMNGWCVAGIALTSCMGVGSAAADQSADTDWAKINSFTWQSTGLSTRFPPMQDTLTGDLGGWRSDLAAHNLGVEMHYNIAGVTDFNANDNKPKDSYVGQNGDLQTSTVTINFTYGLADLGLPNSKIVVCASSTSTTAPNSPKDKIAAGCLSYFQTFFDRKLELKAGFEPNLYNYVGLNTGGDATLTNTAGALIPVEAGLSDPLTTPPMANLTYRGSDGFYVRGGVQRSVAPAGRIYETSHNGIGLDVSMDGAKDLYVGEVGIDRAASQSEHRLWVRAGGISNPSQYNEFKGGEDSNKAYWALADYQLTQPDMGMPMHGLYVGASAMYAPPNVDLYTQNYEVRAYYYGPFASRPLDRVTFTASENKFSDDAQEALAARHIATASTQKSMTATYAAHLAKGVYLSPAIGYTKNPSFNVDINHALTFKLGLLFSF